MISKIADLGGLLFLLTFVHFIVDWGFQSHSEAMRKAANPLVRAWHCTVYTAGVILVPFLLGVRDWDLLYSLGILWISHFIIDTYIPVYVWVRYFRRPPEMTTSVGASTELERFKIFAKAPLGLFLIIVMDQAYHILFLVPVASLALFPEDRTFTLTAAFGMLGSVLGLTLFGVQKLRTDI
jgi:hypothetical protein